MHKSLLLDILKTLSPDEIIKFESLVVSPYFNRNKNVIKLYGRIKKHYPLFTGDALSKEYVWNKMFPDKKYNYGIMKNIIHDLSKLAVKFIELENYSQKKFDEGINILQQYASRGLYKRFQVKHEELKDMMSKDKTDADFYLRRLTLSKVELDLLTVRHTIKDILNYDFNLIGDDLSLFYFSRCFSHYESAFQLAVLYNKSADYKIIEPLIKYYEKFDRKNFYTEAVYYSFKVMHEPFNQSNYYKLKELYFENFDKFTSESKYFITISLLNFCKNNTQDGDLSFIKERYQYNKIIVENNLFPPVNENMIDQYMFMSIVISACTAEEFKWCEGFIEKYNSRLDEKIREQYTNFAFTHLNFKAGNFEKALHYLSKCENASGMDKINIRTFQFFLYYELNYYEELKNLVDNTKHYIRSDKTISDSYKIRYSNFVDAVNRMNEFRYQMKLNGESKILLFEIKKFLSENKVTSPKWVYAKIEELEKL